jgi:hypothetical protein
MFKRIFSRKAPENVSKSIRCTQSMWDAIEKLAAEAGESPNGYIVLVLDQYLQVKVEAGELQLPPQLADGKNAS